jgi:D-beta-D-heptose 7-phosphate kinase/D-beta-D-heptose 1-phosphate adenosyltransferase
MPNRLIEIVEGLPASRIVLIGDLMLDRYLYGNAERLSPDAPVPILHYKYEDSRLGGAGRVAADLAALGADVQVVAIIGPDDTGRQIRDLLTGCGCKVDGLLEVPGRPSTSKVRLVGLAQHRHPQQMMRLDYEDASAIDDTTEKRVLDALAKAIEGAAVVCLEDYDKGLLKGFLCQQVIRLARLKGVPVFVDPAPIADYSKYAGATAITPNRTEAEKATGLPCDGAVPYEAVAERLLIDLGLEAALLTLDKNGIFLATKTPGAAKAEPTRQVWIKGRERKVYDVAGAGDMVLAMLAVARAAGADWKDAAILANTAAGLEVEKFGSVPIKPVEIIQELLSDVRDHLGKRRDPDELLPELQLHRAAGKKIVFTNGCFDLIHLGHIKYFRFAKAQGDLLVVGVNTDAGIRRLKGSKRPIVNESDRLSVLEELESIDYLVTFDEDIPLALIKSIRPDVLVKGADYTKEQVVGWDVVESYGGRVALAPLIDGKSTSNVIEKILEAYGASGKQGRP